MDLQMPVMDGLETVRRLREHEKHQQYLSDTDTPLSTQQVLNQQLVIGFSANSDDETMQEAYKAGINDFITKPFKIDTFIQKIKKINVDKFEVTTIVVESIQFQTKDTQ